MSSKMTVRDFAVKKTPTISITSYSIICLGLLISRNEKTIYVTPSLVVKRK